MDDSAREQQVKQFLAEAKDTLQREIQKSAAIQVLIKYATEMKLTILIEATVHAIDESIVAGDGAEKKTWVH